MDPQNAYETIMADWERTETEQSIPYYINHHAGRTQWDHPVIMKTYEELRAMDNICYAAYRTAAKLIFIQNRLCMNELSLSSVVSVCERHGLAGMDVLNTAAVEALLLDLYALRECNTSSNLTNQHLAELLLNWLLALYDRNRIGKLRMLAIKTCLTVLCSTRLMDKYKYIFQQTADDKGDVSRGRMTELLTYLVRLTDVLGESSSFGGMNVLPAVESCFRGSFNPVGVCEDVFISWVMKEPQTLVWLPTMHRILAAQSVQHDFKCSVCKLCPIIGLRYRCLKCFNYDLCQNCFFTGRSNKKHKLRHPTQEYCLMTTSKENTVAIMKTIRNNLSKRSGRKNKLRYLPISGSDLARQAKPDRQVSNTHEPFDGADASPDTEFPPEGQQAEREDFHHDQQQPLQQGIGEYERRELESIIIHLEKENRGLLREVKRQLKEQEEDGSSDDSDWLEEQNDKLLTKNDIMELHNRLLQQQLDRLRNMLHKPGGREPLGTISHNTTAVKLNNLSKTNKAPPEFKVTPMFDTDTPVWPANTAPATTGVYDMHARTPGVYDMHAVTPGVRSMKLDDLTLASMDGTLGRTYFSLPTSPEGEQDPQQDDDIQELLDKMDKAFPANISQAGDFSSSAAADDILRAASEIGQAMMGFVRQLDTIQVSADGSSLWRLADELGASRDPSEGPMTGHSTFLNSPPTGGLTTTPSTGLPIDLSGGVSYA